MKLRYTLAALNDLADIERYQSQFWPGAKAGFGEKLGVIERQAMNFPYSAPAILQQPDIRVISFVAYPYRLFYRVADDEIEVLAVRHTSRKPPYM